MTMDVTHDVTHTDEGAVYRGHFWPANFYFLIILCIKRVNESITGFTQVGEICGDVLSKGPCMFCNVQRTYSWELSELWRHMWMRGSGRTPK